MFGLVELKYRLPKISLLACLECLKSQLGGSGWWLVVALAQAKQKPNPWKEGQRLLGNKSVV